MSVSVCTIARGRAAHLRRLMAGLSAQSGTQLELVVAHMQPAPYGDLPECGFPVRQVQVPGDRAPLAAARNAAARAARGDTLIFLDVDCVPMPDLVAEYLAPSGAGRCLMGAVRYLSGAERADDLTADALWKAGAQHPARRFSETLGPGVRRIADPKEFWSLSFAMTAQTFRDVDGFDDLFVGYGGEDTDFALRLAQARVDLYWVPAARAVHQWHAVETPPLGHLADIVRNANLFRRKHGVWCMEYWLTQLSDAGYVDWGPELVRILRWPSTDERQAALCDETVRFG